MEEKFGIYASTYRVASVHDYNGWPVNKANAVHIAAMSPERALRLIAAVEAAHEYVHNREVTGSSSEATRAYAALRAALEGIER